MTDFAVTRRLRCRECKTKLPSPTANDNHAFCCKGCHAAFYRQRCAVCEAGYVRRRLCHRPKCRSAYRGNRLKFTFPGLGSGSVKERARNADGMGIKSATDARPWRVIAGPQLTADQLRCATVPDGGEHERIEAKNRAALRAHFAKLAKDCLIQPHHPPVNILGGYRFPGAPVIDLSPPLSAPTIAHNLPVSDDLSIPDFLRRAA